MAERTPELDDDGQPMEPGEKFATEAERAAYWAEVNHAPRRVNLGEIPTGSHLDLGEEWER